MRIDTVATKPTPSQFVGRYIVTDEDPSGLVTYTNTAGEVIKDDIADIESMEDFTLAGGVGVHTGPVRIDGVLYWSDGTQLAASGGTTLPTVSYPNLLEPVDFYGAQITDYFVSKSDGKTYLLGRCDDSNYVTNLAVACNNQSVYRWERNSRTPGVTPSAPVLLRSFSAEALFVKQGPFYYHDHDLLVVQTANTAGSDTATTAYQLWFSWDQGETWIRYDLGNRWAGGATKVGTIQMLNKQTLSVFNMPTTGQKAIFFGWYNTEGTANFEEIQIVASFDRGQTFKTQYAWNLTATSDLNNRVRHIHFCQYNKYNGCLYVGFGDGKVDATTDSNGVLYVNKFGILEVDMTQYAGFPATPDLYLNDSAFNSGAFKALIGNQIYRAVQLAIDSTGKMYYGADQVSNQDEPTKYSGFYSFSKNFAGHTKLGGDLPAWYDEAWNSHAMDDGTVIFTSSPAIDVNRGTVTISAVNATTDEITLTFDVTKGRREIAQGECIWLTGTGAPGGTVITSGAAVAYYWLIKTGTNTAKLAISPKHAEKGIAVDLTNTTAGATVNFMEAKDISIYASTDGANAYRIGLHRLSSTAEGVNIQGIFDLNNELYLTTSGGAATNARKSARATSVSRFSNLVPGQVPTPVVHPTYFIATTGTNVGSTEALKGGFYPCTAMADPNFLLRASPATQVGCGCRVQIAAGTYTTPRTTLRADNPITLDLRACSFGTPVQVWGAGKDLTIWEHDTAAIYHIQSTVRAAGGSTALNLEFYNLHLNSLANAATTTERIIRHDAENNYMKFYNVRIGDGSGNFHHINGGNNQVSLLQGTEVIPSQTGTSASAFYNRTGISYALEIKGAVIEKGYKGILSNDVFTQPVIWDIDHAAFHRFGNRGIDITVALPLTANSNITNTIIASDAVGSNLAVSDAGSGFDWNDGQVNNNAIWTEFGTKVSPASVASASDASVASYASLQVVPGGKHTVATDATASVLNGRSANLVSFGGELTVKNIGPF
jgi:hypothetical protein